MNGCLITNGKTKDCATSSKIGGLQGRLFGFNLYASDGVKVQYTESGNTISDITFSAADGLFEIDGEQFAHNFTYSLSVPGVNKFYTQNGTIKTVVSSDTDIEWLDEMNKATRIGIIYENMNGEFILLGQTNGMKATEGDQFDSGLENTAEIGTTITLMGNENKPFKLFFDTDYNTTLAKLQSLVKV